MQPQKNRIMKENIETDSVHNHSVWQRWHQNAVKKKQSFQKMMLGPLGIHKEKKWSRNHNSHDIQKFTADSL